MLLCDHFDHATTSPPTASPSRVRSVKGLPSCCTLLPVSHVRSCDEWLHAISNKHHDEMKTKSKKNWSTVYFIYNISGGLRVDIKTKIYRENVYKKKKSSTTVQIAWIRRIEQVYNTHRLAGGGGGDYE